MVSITFKPNMIDNVFVNPVNGSGKLSILIEDGNC